MSYKKQFLLRIFLPSIAVAIVVGLFIGFFVLRNHNGDMRIQEKVLTMTAEQPCLPTFEDGGGPYYLPNQPFRTNIAPNINQGEQLIVRGRLLQADCKTPIGGGVIDLWQASEEGSYDNEYYRGQIMSDSKGFYQFETVIPKGYGEGTGYRPPHIHFKVHLNGREQITSQMFFPEAQGRPGFNDEYIMNVEIEGSRENIVYNGYHNIILP